MCVYIYLSNGIAEKPIVRFCSQNFFSRKNFVQLKGELPFCPLMSKYARLPELKGVRVFGGSRLKEQPISRNRTWPAMRLLKRILKCRARFCICVA